MSDITDDGDDEERRKKKKKDEGEGDADSWGRGKAGAGSAMGRVRLPPQKLKEVMADWRHLDVDALIEAVTEFFSELPMRASANLSVFWDKTKRFALVTDVFRAADKMVKDLKLVREKGAGRDTRGFQKDRTKRLRANPTIAMKPEGPGGQ